MSKKGRHSVFSARTTPEGLAILGGLKARLGVNWDKLIIGAVNAHYGIEVPMPALTGPAPEERAKAKAAKDAEKAERAEARAKATAERKAAAEAKAVEKAKAKAERDTAAKEKTKSEKAKAKAKATKDTEKGRRAGAKAPEPKAEKTAEDAKGRPAETPPAA